MYHCLYHKMNTSLLLKCCKMMIYPVALNQIEKSKYSVTFEKNVVRLLLRLRSQSKLNLPIYNRFPRILLIKHWNWCSPHSLPRNTPVWPFPQLFHHAPSMSVTHQFWDYLYWRQQFLHNQLFVYPQNVCT